METLLRIALWNVAFAAALAALAFAVSRLVRRPALAHVLWVLALIRLLAPPVWTVAIHAQSDPQTGSRLRLRQAVEVPVREAASGSAGAPSSFIAGAGRGAQYVAIPVAPKTSRWVVRDWTLPAIFTIWGLGSLTCLLLVLTRIRQFRRTLRHATINPGLQQRVDELSAEIGLRRPPAVRLVPGRVCPMVWWTLGRPKLLLPLRLWAELSPAKRDALIVHELAHLKRHDHWVRIIELLATILYWWDPLVWWARHELRIAEEQCCDAWVTRALPASGAVYASALVDAIDFVSSFGMISNPRLPALASGTGEFRHLQRRLVMIQQGTSIRPLGRASFAMICCAALVLPLSFTRGQSATRDASGHSAHDEAAAAPTTRPTSDEDAAATTLLNHVLPEVQFNGVSFTDVVDFLRDATGANIFVNWRVLDAAGISKDTPITVRFRRVKFSKALATVLEAAGGDQVRLGYYFDDNVLTITTADDASRMTVTRVYDIKDLLSGDAKASTEELIKAITKSCAPDSWKDNGGGVGAISPVGQMLVVVQTDQNQRLVKDLLEKTRKAEHESSGK